MPPRPRGEPRTARSWPCAPTVPPGQKFLPDAFRKSLCNVILYGDMTNGWCIRRPLWIERADIYFGRLRVRPHVCMLSCDQIVATPPDLMTPPVSGRRGCRDRH